MAGGGSGVAGENGGAVWGLGCFFLGGGGSLRPTLARSAQRPWSVMVPVHLRDASTTGGFVGSLVGKDKGGTPKNCACRQRGVWCFPLTPLSPPHFFPPPFLTPCCVAAVPWKVKRQSLVLWRPPQMTGTPGRCQKKMKTERREQQPQRSWLRAGGRGTAVFPRDVCGRTRTRHAWTAGKVSAGGDGAVGAKMGHARTRDPAASVPL